MTVRRWTIPPARNCQSGGLAMAVAGGTWRDGKPGYGTRTTVAMILGPATCPTCLERYGSALHRELCEVNA